MVASGDISASSDCYGDAAGGGFSTGTNNLYIRKHTTAGSADWMALNFTIDEDLYTQWQSSDGLTAASMKLVPIQDNTLADIDIDLFAGPGQGTLSSSNDPKDIYDAWNGSRTSASLTLDGAPTLNVAYETPDFASVLDTALTDASYTPGNDVDITILWANPTSTASNGSFLRWASYVHPTYAKPSINFEFDLTINVDVYAASDSDMVAAGTDDGIAVPVSCGRSLNTTQYENPAFVEFEASYHDGMGSATDRECLVADPIPQPEHTESGCVIHFQGGGYASTQYEFNISGTADNEKKMFANGGPLKNGRAWIQANYKVSDDGAMWPEPAQDARTCVAWAIDNYGTDYMLMGHSAGAHLASFTAFFIQDDTSYPYTTPERSYTYTTAPSDTEVYGQRWNLHEGAAARKNMPIPTAVFVWAPPTDWDAIYNIGFGDVPDAVEAILNTTSSTSTGYGIGKPSGELRTQDWIKGEGTTGNETDSVYYRQPFVAFDHPDYDDGTIVLDGKHRPPCQIGAMEGRDDALLGNGAGNVNTFDDAFDDLGIPNNPASLGSPSVFDSCRMSPYPATSGLHSTMSQWIANGDSASEKLYGHDWIHYRGNESNWASSSYPNGTDLVEDIWQPWYENQAQTGDADVYGQPLVGAATVGAKGTVETAWTYTEVNAVEDAYGTHDGLTAYDEDAATLVVREDTSDGVRESISIRFAVPDTVDRDAVADARLALYMVDEGSSATITGDYNWAEAATALSTANDTRNRWDAGGTSASWDIGSGDVLFQSPNMATEVKAALNSATSSGGFYYVSFQYRPDATAGTWRSFASEDHPTLAVPRLMIGESSGLAVSQPSRIESTATFYTPTLVPQEATISPGFIASTAAVREQSVDPQEATLSPGFISSTATVYTPSFGTGAQTLTPATIASTATFYTPSFSTGEVALEPGYITSTATVYQPGLVLVGDDTQAMFPAAIGSTAQVFAAQLAPQEVALTPGYIASTEALYAPTLTGKWGLEPGTIAATSVVYDATLTLQDARKTVSPGVIASTAVVYGPELTVIGGVVDAAAAGWAAAKATAVADSHLAGKVNKRMRKRSSEGLTERVEDKFDVVREDS